MKKFNLKKMPETPKHPFATLPKAERQSLRTEFFLYGMDGVERRLPDDLSPEVRAEMMSSFRRADDLLKVVRAEARDHRDLKGHEFTVVTNTAATVLCDAMAAGDFPELQGDSVLTRVVEVLNG